MIDDDTLLFPDTGPDLIRALRSAVLYSEKVHTLTLFNIETANRVVAAFRDSGPPSGNSTVPMLANRVRGYFSFIQQHHAELKAFRAEGVWVPLGVDQSQSILSGTEAVKGLRKLALQGVRTDAFERFITGADETERHAEETEPAAFLSKRLNEAFALCPPSYGDLILISFVGKHLIGKTQPQDVAIILREQELACKVAFVRYLLTLSVLAETKGVAFTSWHPLFLDTLWGCRERVAQPQTGENTLAARRMAEMRIGQTVLERHLPRADDLPVDALLEIRRKRASEIQAFRVGVRSLATQIDVTKPLGSFELQVRDLAARLIDPAVRELSSAIMASRLEIVSKIGSSWTGKAGALVPAAISFAAGMPLELSAAVGAVAALGGPALDAYIQRKQLLNASQWAILWRLDQQKPR